MLKPVRYDLYEKALNKPKTKIDKRMITEQQYFLFTEWAGDRYNRANGKWYAKDGMPRLYTTRELWELYQKFLGKKPG